jgi:hypothetical protein
LGTVPFVLLRSFFMRRLLLVLPVLALSGCAANAAERQLADLSCDAVCRLMITNRSAVTLEVTAGQVAGIVGSGKLMELAVQQVPGRLTAAYTDPAGRRAAGSCRLVGVDAPQIFYECRGPTMADLSGAQRPFKAPPPMDNRPVRPGNPPPPPTIPDTIGAR